MLPFRKIAGTLTQASSCKTLMQNTLIMTQTVIK